MMDNVKLLIDIGSTFTKVVAIDLEREEVVSRVDSPSTVEEDVTILASMPYWVLMTS